MKRGQHVLPHGDYAAAVYEALVAAGLRPAELAARSVEDADFSPVPLRVIELAWPPSVDRTVPYGLRLEWASRPLGWLRYRRGTGEPVLLPLDPVASPAAVVGVVAHLLPGGAPQEVPISADRWDQAEDLEQALAHGAGEDW